MVKKDKFNWFRVFKLILGLFGSNLVYYAGVGLIGFLLHVPFNLITVLLVGYYSLFLLSSAFVIINLLAGDDFAFGVYIMLVFGLPFLIPLFTFCSLFNINFGRWLNA